MALALEDFARSVLEAGFSSEANLHAEIEAVRSDSGSPTVEDLARRLVQTKVLTAYQAKQIVLGRGRSLTLGNYVVLDKLGEGGMGMVLKARHRRMDRVVALKVLASAWTNTPEAIRRFEREVKAVAALDHPNIVAAYDADEADGTHFLVMQFVEGTDLSVLVKAQGPLPVAQAIVCVRQTARGLEYAHAHGIVHRDIKPANLLLDRDGTVKILDLGLARLESDGEADQLTGTGQVMGTVDYMAPEQARDTRQADARSDIYSLGVTLWYLLTGRSLYAGDSIVSKLLAHQTAPIPSLTESYAAVPSDLDTIFTTMVAKNPWDRYPTMTAVLAALEGLDTGSGSVPAVSPRSGEQTRLAAFFRGDAVEDAGRTVAATQLGTALAMHGVLQAPATDFTLGRTVPSLLGETITHHPAEASLSGPPTAALSSEALGPAASPTPEPRSAISIRRSRTGWWIGLGLGGAGAALTLALGVLFLIQTPTGVLRVEIEDPAIEVAVQGTTVLLKGADGGHNVVLEPGEKTLRVTRGDLTFETKALNLKQGDTTTVDVKFLDGAIIATAGDVVLGRQTVPPEPNRSGDPMSAPPARLASDSEPPTPPIDSPLVDSPSALDRLRPEDVPIDTRRVVGGGDPNAIANVVAVWGDGRFGSWLQDIAISPDGASYATVSDSAIVVSLWDAATGLPRHTLHGHQGGAVRVAFTRDGQHVISAANLPSVGLHDVQSGQQLWIVKRNQDAGSVLALGERVSDGTLLVGLGDLRTRPAERRAGVDILDRNTGERRGGFDLLPPGTTLSAFNSDGTLAAIVRWGDEPAMEIRRTEDGELVQTIPGRFGTFSLAFSRDGQHLSASTADTDDVSKDLRLWSTRTWESTTTIPLDKPGRILQTEFGPDGQLAIHLGDRLLRIDPSAGQIHTIRDEPCRGFAISSDGKTLVTNDRANFTIVRRWPEGDPDPNAPTLGSRVWTATLSPDGRLMALGYYGTDGSVGLEVRDVATGQVRTSFSQPREQIAWLADNKSLIASSRWSTPVLHSIGQSTEHYRYQAFRKANPGIMTFGLSPDSSRIAFLIGGRVHLFDATREIPLWQSEPKFSQRSDVKPAFSADSSLVAVPTDDPARPEVQIWRTDDGTPVRTLTAPVQNDRLRQITFSPDGRQLAAAHRDGPILWTASDGWDQSVPQRREFTQAPALLPWQGYTEVAFRPDGQRLAAVSDETKITIWDTDGSSVPVHVLEHAAQFRPLRNLSYAPDGRHLIGVNDGTAIALRVPPERPLPIEPDAAGLAFDGGGGRVATPIPWDGSSPLTVEAWVRPTFVGDGYLFHNGRMIFKLSSSGSVVLTWHDGTAWNEVARGRGAIPGQVAHVAAVIERGRSRVYINGRETCRGSLPEGPPPGPIQFNLGANPIGGGAFRGVMSEARVSSVARYTTNFSPQRRFEPDDQTLALYHMEEGQGETLHDASRHQHHGKILGPSWVQRTSADPGKSE